MHFVIEAGGRIAAHALVVPRTLHLGGRTFRAGYVEAVATRPELQRQGLGSRLMSAVNEWIRDEYELGALGTGRHAFYQRLDWLTWRGPSFVRTATGDVPTPDDDGYILILPTPTSPSLELDARIVCEWRPGDVW
jgi:aminoglycoside 2'-N-acetyltransferase I